MFNENNNSYVFHPYFWSLCDVLEIEIYINAHCQRLSRQISCTMWTCDWCPKYWNKKSHSKNRRQWMRFIHKLENSVSIHLSLYFTKCPRFSLFNQTPLAKGGETMGTIGDTWISILPYAMTLWSYQTHKELSLRSRN